MATGQHIPTTPAEYIEHNFGYDVIKEAEAWCHRYAKAGSLMEQRPDWIDAASDSWNINKE